MAMTVGQTLTDRHRLLPEKRHAVAEADLRMAKAELRKTEKAEHDDWILLGKAVERCIYLTALSLKEFAGVIDRDERQVARWIHGTERTQVDTIFAVPQFRRSFVVALAEQAGEGVEVTTAITITRRLA